MQDDAPGRERASTGPEPAVSLRAVCKAYDNGVRALDALDLDVGRGEFVALLGPSGCGKSTALRLVAGLSRPTAGEIRIARAAPRRHAGHAIGFVFQEPTLMPWASVFDNVHLPLRLVHAPRPDAEARVRSALDGVGLADFARAYPRELSGGMKMRVSLARALVTDPDILLMDEPFAALDALTRRHLQDDLMRLAEQRRFTLVFVTHAIDEAVLIGTRLHLLSPHPGRTIASFDTAEPDFSRPDSPRFQAAVRDIHGLLFDRVHGAAA